MTFIPTATVMLIAQLLSLWSSARRWGLPSRTIANNFTHAAGHRARAALPSTARAGAGVALSDRRILVTLQRLRPAFGILIVLSSLGFLGSFRLSPIREGRCADRRRGCGARAAPSSYHFGFNNLIGGGSMGAGVARPRRPVHIMVLSAGGAVL